MESPVDYAIYAGVAEALQPLHTLPSPCFAPHPQVGLKSVISELELKLEHHVVDNGANFSLVGLLYFLQGMVWMYRAR